MDTLISNFVRLCQIAPKLLTNIAQSQPKCSEKTLSDPPAPKVVKRTSKKRKTSDNQELVNSTSKRRHKKQLTESQSKGGKDTNEHKLPLKKRHYHINSSTSNSLSLSLVSSEFDENSKNGMSTEKFLCTETDCLGDMQNNISTETTRVKGNTEKGKKSNDTSKAILITNYQETKNQNKNDEIILKTSKGSVSTISEKIDIQQEESNSCPSESNTNDKSPEALANKIDKEEEVHKILNDLEKLTKTSKESDVKMLVSKQENFNKTSPRSEIKSSPIRNCAPIVTPKKRHRLEADKAVSHSSLDQVVQSLSKKLSEDKSTKEVVQNNSKEDVSQNNNLENSTVSQSNTVLPSVSISTDPLKSMSARSLYKSSIPPSQKSEIMTRKKNRLEGLTSNLVSKINPSAATKVLDTLLNNNIRKSIESRILEKEKKITDCSNKITDDKPRTKESSIINTRATVIKSPVSKGKTIDVKKFKNSEVTTEKTVVVNVDQPTGIFEPSIDLEEQIPKSSICVNSIVVETNRDKCKIKGNDSKSSVVLLDSMDAESDIPLALISETPDPIIRPKRGESIAAVISDKIQETASGHNLRQPKRNLSIDNEETIEKKKKKTSNSIIKESKLVLPAKVLIPKIQTERVIVIDVIKKMNTLQANKSENNSIERKIVETSKKKPRRRKAINRTGFPNIKKKKKKTEHISALTIQLDSQCTSGNENSAFERVPKDGEAMSSFLQRTTNRKPELKVVLNKDECPKQGRLTVVALEKLQGKEYVAENESRNVHISERNISGRKPTNSILRAPALQLKQTKNDKELKNHINKWEVLSETESIPSFTSSLSNDPEDSIPLSLLHLKENKSISRLDNIERLKRKTRAMSPSNELEDIFSKRRMVEKISRTALRPKSSLAILCPSERRLTRSSDNPYEDARNKIKKDAKKSTAGINDEKSNNKPKNVIVRRKSRLCQITKKQIEEHSSSRESSLDTVISRKITSKSREPSIDTLQDNDENDPLPLNEKEIDFEKSIDVLSKSIICKKRVVSSRDDSPASSVDNKEKPIVSKRNPRLRKKFLVAGLFSEYYKEDPKPEGKGKNLVTQTEFPPGLLAPPPYCERWVRRRLQHFALPYDIWWQQHYNQPVPSWNYKKIRTNVYYDVKPSAEECESVACNCAPASGCNEDCINRLVYSECSPQLCPAGDKCKNQRIQRHEWASGLEKFMTENKGWGVRTKHRITSGDFILEYVGEVVSDKEFKERMATRYARDTHHYCLHLDGGLVIDGHRMGGDGRFVNHSCRPNCEMQKWTSNGTFRMALFALRDIDPGEELTYDYNFSLFNPAVGQPCKCDSEDCRGVIGGKSQRITKQPVKTQSRTPSNASNQSHSSNGNPLRVGRPRKAAKCNKKSEQPSVTACDLKNMTILKYQQHLNKLWQEPQMKPLTVRERNLVKERHCFLFRNLENVRRIRERLSLSMPPSPPSGPVSALTAITPPGATSAPATAVSTTAASVTLVPSTTSAPVPPAIINVDPLVLPDTMNPAIFLKRLQMLRASKEESTKELLRFEDDPSLEPKQRLARVFKALFNYIGAVKDEEGKQICTPLMKIKAERSKQHENSNLDLNTIENNINCHHYDNIAQFDTDMNNLFSTVIREQGRSTVMGVAATQLKKVYNSAKSDFAEQLTKVLGSQESFPSGFAQKSKTEEVILCICGLHVEEGLMVQCGGSGCGVWQHARCMRVADTTAPHYCHNCAQRPVDREIPLDDYTEEGHQFYLSLMRGGLQVRQGDTVYVLRDIPIDDKHPDVSAGVGDKTETSKTKRVDRKKLKGVPKGKDKEDVSSNKTGKEVEVRKHTYQTIGEIPVSELDIFRVERMWKHKDTQERYVYGHHYLRPHETFHEPTRKFFPNEVMRVPLYEAVPIELVMSQCWVMDLNSYCKGRPVGAREEHVYICELRVDRTARLFTKVSRPKYPLCTKPYAFDHFPQRLKISRTYAPHEVSPEYLKGRAGKNSTTNDKANKVTIENKKKTVSDPVTVAIKASSSVTALERRERQKERVNNIARRLLGAGTPRGTLDASYLLAPRAMGIKHPADVKQCARSTEAGVRRSEQQQQTARSSRATRTRSRPRRLAPRSS